MLEKCPDLNRYCAEGGAEGAGDGAPDGAAGAAPEGVADADGAVPPPADDGLTDLIQAITFHTLSESLRHAAHWRHRADHVLAAFAGVALLLQFIRAERDQPEQRVVVAAIDLDRVCERRTHAAAGAAVTAGRHEFLMAFLLDLLEIRIRALERALLGALGEVLRITSATCRCLTCCSSLRLSGLGLGGTSASRRTLASRRGSRGGGCCRLSRRSICWRLRGLCSVTEATKGTIVFARLMAFPCGEPRTAPQISADGLGLNDAGKGEFLAVSGRFFWIASRL